MEEFKRIVPEYLKTLNKRGETSRVYTSHQLTGLILADILEDREHKSLYMRLAKKHEAQELIGLAKRIAGNPNIKKKGAYFMRVWYKK